MLGPRLGCGRGLEAPLPPPPGRGLVPVTVELTISECVEYLLRVLTLSHSQESEPPPGGAEEGQEIDNPIKIRIISPTIARPRHPTPGPLEGPVLFGIALSLVSHVRHVMHDTTGVGTKQHDRIVVLIPNQVGQGTADAP